jgi:hypothetical protein
MASEEDEKRWRTALEDIGATNVTILLNHIDPLHPEALIASVGDREPWPSRGFVEKWLREQEAATQRKERRRFGWMLGVGIVAAVAATIAAWPEIKSFFHPYRLECRRASINPARNSAACCPSMRSRGY